MAKQPWKAWHEVVKLREDLRSGDLPLHLFAADLYEVMMQNGKRPIYEKPEEFFALTFPTHNLRNLVRDVVLRLAGKNDKAVRQLELTYGGGKTHTLITLWHIAHDPAALPDLPAVHEFFETIGITPPKARIAALCFDKLDVEKGMDVRGPDGAIRRLKHPWNVLAFQIAGDDGLKLLHAEGKAEERETAPAENTLTDLLELPLKEKLGTLVLIDEVLMYAREKVAQDRSWRDRLIDFFQYLTQAATKVDRCCIVASLLATDPKKSGDEFGRQLLGDLYDIFRREKEEGVEPVVKEDVAEVLRRRFFTPESLKNQATFKQHMIAALKGIQAVDEQMAKQGAAAEERFLKSFPFHPDLTEVFYGKWTQLTRFQRTRGVLRTFALALREAEKWDTCPLIGPAVFLNAAGRDGLSEAARELVTVADTEEHEGRKQAWTGIIDTELARAKQIQNESVGLRMREIEQAVMATFMHSQPIGQSAKTRDLVLLIGASRPDKIELEKGLVRWAQSSYWLDDTHLPEKDDQLPGIWRLGNRPNLNQMQAAAAAQISDNVVKARLVEEIGKAKTLTSGTSASGVRVHTLPTKPRDIEDDGLFHYAVLPPSAASDSGKPSAEAKRFLDETTGPEKPRVFRNAVLMLAPSRDGLEVAQARVRDYLAWERVMDDLTPKNDEEKKQKGPVDVARLQTLKINIDKAKARVPEAIRQAYCIVVTVSDKDDVQAFQIKVIDEVHFEMIKRDSRSRVQDTAITAEALLPDGPYNLWKGGETSRRVKDLAGAFAQLPHLPKMLKSQAIVETLVDGCVQGTFVLKLTRPDRTFRTWWRTRPDDAVLQDPALELILPHAAELADIAPDLLVPRALPELWAGDEITADSVAAYFDGTKVVQVQREGFTEPVQIPKAPRNVVEAALAAAVENGRLWLLSGPASLLGEPLPTGVLTGRAALRSPPAPVPAPEILPENLPDAWKEHEATALSIATALSQKNGRTLPWKTVKDAIAGALQARFVTLADGSGVWPCDIAAAHAVRLKLSPSGTPREVAAGVGGETPKRPHVLIASAEFEPSELQDLSDSVPRLLEIRAKTKTAIRFRVHVEVGDGAKPVDDTVVQEIRRVLGEVKPGMELQ